VRLRRAQDASAPRPHFIWEPVPDLCKPDELLSTTNALRYVDICSPNHAELGALMGTSGLTPSGEVDKVFVEEACEQLLASMPLVSFALVIRCGAEGCYIAQNGGKPPAKKKRKTRSSGTHVHGGLTEGMDFEKLFAKLLAPPEEPEDEVEEEPQAIEGIERWIPAVHTDASKVIDPTGGGNGFLGGLAVALARSHTLEEAAAWGSVSASFAIEQVGMPILGHDDEGKETWNGVIVEDRLSQFKQRMGWTS
jgi:sugar/nucleoside kinase (ribokinase family)